MVRTDNDPCVFKQSTVFQGVHEARHFVVDVPDHSIVDGQSATHVVLGRFRRPNIFASFGLPGGKVFTTALHRQGKRRGIIHRVIGAGHKIWWMRVIVTQVKKERSATGIGLFKHAQRPVRQ